MFTSDKLECNSTDPYSYFNMAKPCLNLLHQHLCGQLMDIRGPAPITAQTQSRALFLWSCFFVVFKSLLLTESMKDRRDEQHRGGRGTRWVVSNPY